MPTVALTAVLDPGELDPGPVVDGETAVSLLDPGPKLHVLHCVWRC